MISFSELSFKTVTMEILALTTANNKFCVDLFKTIREEKRKENVFISPFSIAAAVSMTHLGAKDATADGIAKALRWQPGKEHEIHKQFQTYLTLLKSPSDKFNLSTANRIFMQQNFKILDEFKAKTNTYYLAG